MQVFAAMADRLIQYQTFAVKWLLVAIDCRAPWLSMSKRGQSLSDTALRTPYFSKSMDLAVLSPETL